MGWCVRNPAARTQASLSVRFASKPKQQTHESFEGGHTVDTDDDSTPKSSHGTYTEKVQGGKPPEKSAAGLWTRMEVPREKEVVDALREMLFQQEMPYTVTELGRKLVLAGWKPCFTTELKKRQDVTVISILIRALTTCPKKAVGSEVAEWHSLCHSSGDGAVLDILQEIHNQPYRECFAFHHQWFFLPLEYTGGLCAEGAAASHRGGKGCTWRILVELSFRTLNEIQPFVEAHVLKELRKDYTLSVDLASEWMASHQGKVVWQSCCRAK